LDENQEVVGTIMGGFDGKKGYMYRLAVSSKFRNRGLGTDLINKAEESFKEQGVKNIRLTVMIYKLNLIDFYNHRGYESLTDEMEMEKKL
jgi:ribosomal protein S18 acetylase RimI-like enzyme